MVFACTSALVYARILQTATCCHHLAHMSTAHCIKSAASSGGRVFTKLRTSPYESLDRLLQLHSVPQDLDVLKSFLTLELASLKP